jgi:hypothetical protein
MRISIIVKANSKKNEILSTEVTSKFRILVKEPAIEGKANEAVIKLLAEHFKVPKLNIKIIHGLKSKNKVVEVKL